MLSHRTSRMPVPLRYLWASPATAVGLAVAAVARLSGARASWRHGALEVAGGRMGASIRRVPRLRRFHAVTFGHVIVAVDDAALVASRPHERVHVRQYERWGPVLLPAYLGSSLWEAVRGRDPYWGNRFEREARRLSAVGDRGAVGDR